ncbi:MAG: DNA-binding response regulator [Desulfuromonas sp.]|nr:MAG: DNA-binding response regulator [Desulfuromonas sp.]
MAEKPVLIIEDDISLRRVLEFTLEEAGYQVHTAVDGEQGLDRFAQIEPALVVTDIQMPGISGIEVLKKIKQQAPQTLVMVITAFASVEQAVEAMKEGAFDYLTKPFSRDQLRITVKKAFDYLGLQQENARLREELGGRRSLEEIVGLSDGMQQVTDMIKRVAPSEATVLIEGESGTGKELVARAIHDLSERHKAPFVAVNCAAIPRDLIESELFGHLRGAFTGAVRDRTGKFEQAQGGTLFLDEVGELPLELQPKLLRALQEKEVEPVGGVPRSVDVRLVAATNRHLETALEEGLFREDLYYRLAVVPLQLPPLRQRREDIVVLLRHFLGRHGVPEVELSQGLIQRLTAYRWPGNVRELQNVVERMLVMRRGDTLDVEDLPVSILNGQRARVNKVINLPDDGYPLEKLEEEVVREALERCDWNQTRAASFLDIPRHVLVYRMEKYHISRS